MKKIKITLHKDGTQKVEVLGAVGDECMQFTRDLEQRLGTPVGDRVLKPEFEHTQTEAQQDFEVDR